MQSVQAEILYHRRRSFVKRFFEIIFKNIFKKILTRAEKCGIMYLQGKARATAKQEREEKKNEKN